MSRRIQILPDHVANQIAAGEVVERPASAVKELVENALDAGAARVEISLRNGGKTEIRVADDGSGMEREDALLALDRHATSKIRGAEDLQAIGSFGFRGEALPSIAAVSRLELETAPEDGVGTRVRVEAGRVLGVEEVARRRGTTVTVRSLFRNVPVRAEYLGSAAVETRAASDAVLLLALSNLAVAFLLESNGRELLRLPVAGGLRERVAAVWGDERAESLLELEGNARDLCVGGLAERPDAAGRGGGRRFLFVNGRPFVDTGLVRAVDEAYRTTVAPGIRPWLFLDLRLPAAAVDVNVHPAKAEVRFRDRQAVEAAVREAVLAALAGEESHAPLGGVRLAAGSSHAGAEAPIAAAPGSEARTDLAGEAEATDTGAGVAGTPAGAEGDAELETPQLAFFVREVREEARAASPDRDGQPLTALVPRPPDLWQLHRSYILAPTRGGLLIIDQHSAHERVLFEETIRHFEGEQADSQRLLFPITFRLSPAEFSAAEELSGLLRKIGFEVAPFGDRTLVLHAAPNPHPYFDPERCLRDMIRELTEGSPLVDSARNQHERIAKSMACKGAIKAGQALSAEEMAELFDRLFATELPGHDVHGRPTIVRLGLEELERRFGRS